MGSNVSKAEGQAYRGLGIPSPRWKAENFVAADSSITQANPRPGVSVASQKTDLVVETSGNMPTVSGVASKYTLTTIRGGMPEIQGARFTWSPNFAIPAGHLDDFGWEAPNAISRQEIVYAGTDITLAGCIRLQDNSVLLGASPAATGLPFVLRKTFDAAGYASTGTPAWSWSAPATLPTPAPATVDYVPGTLCFLQLPEGRVHAYYVVEDTTIAGYEFFQVVMCWSDDNGANWKRANSYALNEQISASGSPGAAAAGFEVYRMRCAYNDEEVLILISGSRHNTDGTLLRNVWFQYASSDLGHRFSRIDLGGADGAYVDDGVGTNRHVGAFHDVVSLPNLGGFGISYVAGWQGGAGTRGGIPHWKVLGSAFTAWDDITPVALLGAGLWKAVVASDLLTETNTTAAVDENGVIWVAWQESPNLLTAFDLPGTSSQAVSYDGGVTFTQVGAELSAVGDFVANAIDHSTWWDSGDTDYFPDGYCSTFQCGRLLVFAANFYRSGEPDPILEDNNVWELDLGGYSTVTRYHKDSEEVDDRQLTWDRNWAASVRMQDVAGWAATGTGTETLGTGISTLTTTAGQTIERRNPGLAAVVGGNWWAHGTAEWRTTAGTSGLDIVINNGATDVSIYIRSDATDIVVRDEVAAANLATVALPAAGAMTQYFWALDYANLTLKVWARTSSTDRENRPWKVILARTAVTAGGVVASSYIGPRQGQNTTAEWRDVHWGSGVYGMRQALDTADVLSGREWSGLPVHVGHGDGVRVRAVDGPTWSSATSNPDVFEISQRFEYAIENIFPDRAASPRKTWRSTGLTQQDIVVKLGLSADPAPMLGSVLFVAAFNVNFQKFDVAIRTVSGGGWTTIGTLHFGLGATGLQWIRDGRIVRPAGAASGSNDYYTYNILEDSHLLIHKGAADVVKTIATNTEGSFYGPAATTLQPRIYCADIDGSEDASGTVGEIWSKDGIILIHDVPDNYEVRIQIPAGLTAEGYFEIGTLVVGHVAYFGRQYARGRTMGLEPNIALATGRGGSRRAQILGPARRSIEFAWDDALTDATQIAQASSGAPLPDYILPATGSNNPAATPADTPAKMAGLIEQARGSATPLVYISQALMVASEATDQVIVNRNLFMFGRLMAASRIETDLGDEGASEVSHHTAVPFEEEV